MPTDCHQIVQRKPTARSATSNGKRLLGGIDGRCTNARRLHDLIADLSAEIGGAIGETERLQIRTAAGLVLHAEQLTADMVNGKPVDSEELTRASNCAARLLAQLRKTKAAKPKRSSEREALFAELAAGRASGGAG